MEKELIHRLIDIKTLMEHGIIHMEDRDRIGRLLAIHHSHQAIELTLRIKAEEFGSNAYNYNQLKDALKKNSIPHERSLDELNKTRNLVQHYGQIPDQITVIRLVSIARESLIEFWEKQFNIDYFEISLIDLLNDKEIQVTLKKAVTLLKGGKFIESTQQSILAINRNIWKLVDKFPEPEIIGFEVGFAHYDEFLFPLVSMPFASKIKSLLKKTGINWYENSEGTPSKHVEGHYVPTEIDAVYSHNLAIEYSLWTEQIYF